MRKIVFILLSLVAMFLPTAVWAHDDPSSDEPDVEIFDDGTHSHITNVPPVGVMVGNAPVIRNHADGSRTAVGMGRMRIRVPLPDETLTPEGQERKNAGLSVYEPPDDALLVCHGFGPNSHCSWRGERSVGLGDEEVTTWRLSDSGQARVDRQKRRIRFPHTNRLSAIETSGGEWVLGGPDLVARWASVDSERCYSHSDYTECSAPGVRVRSNSSCTYEFRKHPSSGLWQEFPRRCS